MRNFLLCISYLALTWQSCRLLVEGAGLWHEDHQWLERAAWIVGTLACIIIQHGKPVSRYLSKMLRSVSLGARRASRFFDDCYRNWDESTSVRTHTSPTGQSRVGVPAIKDANLGSLRPTFPPGVLVTLMIVVAAAIAALIVGAGESNRTNPALVAETQIYKSKEKEDRLKSKISFADRFIVPGDCSACGGPDVELVPMPKPNPLRRKK
jgi:hypothetical protein